MFAEPCTAEIFLLAEAGKGWGRKQSNYAFIYFFPLLFPPPLPPPSQSSPGIFVSETRLSMIQQDWVSVTHLFLKSSPHLSIGHPEMAITSFLNVQKVSSKASPSRKKWGNSLQSTLSSHLGMLRSKLAFAHPSLFTLLSFNTTHLKSITTNPDALKGNSGDFKAENGHPNQMLTSDSDTCSVPSYHDYLHDVALQSTVWANTSRSQKQS